MNRLDTEQRSSSVSVVASTVNTRLTGSKLIVARVLWLALVIPSLGLFVVSLPVYYQQLQKGCVDPLTCSISGALPSPVLALPYSFESFLGSASIPVFFLLFPNGRLTPRWMGLILLLVIIYAFLNNLPYKGSPFDMYWPAWLYVLVTLVLFGFIIYSQIYRYRRVSTPVQRQQTKWIVLGVTAAVGTYIGLLFISLLSPFFDSTIFGNEVWSLILPVVLLVIPLSIGFSILRYRLYDIDVLINRALVYGTLTVLLALVYVGLVIGLQSLVRLFAGQFSQSPIVIVASTLVIAALFQPLRHRIQAIIDRRFYRRKYDAVKTLEAFSTTLRNEVDLSQLCEHLVTVVKDTMQPSYVSLWLRESGSKLSHPDRMSPSQLSK
ncbi:MAG: hypothetical protein NVSMB27_24920 [Ktedonobacteraceae bacterium]